MALRLFDSLQRELLELKAAQSDGVFRFYNCGPTVYAAAHIGNFRTFIVNDLIRRLVDRQFGVSRVKHVRNLTDVDDKTIRRSREEGRPLGEVTRQWTDKFHQDCDALNCLRPHVEPAATAHIPEQIDMIAALERRGHAYRTDDGSVYFKVASFNDYGSLSKVKERELKVGAALRAAPVDSDEKEDGSDFALWKGHKSEDGDVFWPSPWGKGRPGWHIECSAMSKKHLGDTIDLHTGGVDLLFPHHENEIAQSQCCNERLFSHHWYHSEHLLVDGKKMSKSLGNLYTLEDLLQKGFTAMSVRYALLSGHPRKQLNFTLDSVHGAEKALASLRAFRSSLPGTGGRADAFASVFSALEDDLNTPAALGALFTLINRPTKDLDVVGFDAVLSVLGLQFERVEKVPLTIPPEVQTLADQRWAAKQARDFKTADSLRASLAAAGWSMLDGKEGYSLEPLKR